MTDDTSTHPTGPGPPRTAVGTDDGAPGAVDATPGSVSVHAGGPRTRVVLVGEIDAGLGAALLDASADAEEAGAPVEVDAGRVTFMDSTGIAFIARLASRSTERLLLLRPPPLVRFLVEVTSIDQVLRIVDGPDDDGPAGPGGLAA